jgi:hypothetical protein
MVTRVLEHPHSYIIITKLLVLRVVARVSCYHREEKQTSGRDLYYMIIYTIKEFNTFRFMYERTFVTSHEKYTKKTIQQHSYPTF